MEVHDLSPAGAPLADAAPQNVGGRYYYRIIAFTWIIVRSGWR
jgi:hypothetical protein